jgi:hypothetical protein
LMETPDKSRRRFRNIEEYIQNYLDRDEQDAKKEVELQPLPIPRFSGCSEAIRYIDKVDSYSYYEHSDLKLDDTVKDRKCEIIVSDQEYQNMQEKLLWNQSRERAERKKKELERKAFLLREEKKRNREIEKLRTINKERCKSKKK